MPFILIPIMSYLIIFILADDLQELFFIVGNNLIVAYKTRILRLHSDQYIGKRTNIRI